MYDGIKGFRDFYPAEMAAHREVIDTVEDTAARYGFREISTPALEETRMYVEKSGEEIVEDLYSFEDQGGRDVALTPELTPTVARMVVEKQQAGQGQMPVVPDEVTTYGYLAQNRHVVDAFRDGENASEDLRDGLEVVELCMASYMAAERGERVVFDEVDLADYVPEPARGDFDPSPEGLTGENQ